MVVEPLDEFQTYVEDCEVCCNPIRITFRLDEDGNLKFDAEPLD